MDVTEEAKRLTTQFFLTETVFGKTQIDIIAKV